MLIYPLYNTIKILIVFRRDLKSLFCTHALSEIYAFASHEPNA